jgi:hypothetical protein
MEQQIERRRELLEAPLTEPEPELDDDDDDRPHEPSGSWSDEDGSVKIVPAARVIPTGPIDAD